ncbi:MAG: molybdopterin molybdotransferase MoeA [Spirochaetales bacterium]|nr:molybdopterin molybdotransferase MoeA [Spirochaetales bacterium]
MRTNLHPDEALEIVLQAARAAHQHLAEEKIPLEQALGRALAHDVLSPIDHPPFDKAAMDGFAFRESQPGRTYTVIDAVPAGKSSSSPLGEGEVMRIMTGAPIPPGAAGVQRFEWTRDAGTDAEGRPLVTFTQQEKITNIIARGENLRQGEPLLSPRMLQPQDIGILAASGIAKVQVWRKPRVSIISTGDEIVAAGTALPPSCIYDSNGPQLVAQAQLAGAEARFLGIVPDRVEALRGALATALAESEIVILSGGVSMGDFDLIPKVLRQTGVAPVFHTLKMRPGKPTFFGVRDRVAVFGLPGNPVSTFVNFEVLVKPFILASMGLEHAPRMIRARLASALSRKGSDRVEFLPCTLAADEQGMLVRPLRYHGSSMITVLAHAQALVRMELGQERIEAGEYLDARLIRA